MVARMLGSPPASSHPNPSSAPRPDAGAAIHVDASDLDSQQQRLRALQIRAFVLTWLSYASYYFTRKNLAVTKSRLHDTLGLSTAALGSIDTLYLVAYAIGQFANGSLGDRIGPRRLIALGMLASAITALCFGLSSAYLPMLIAFGVNGLFQASGWPGNVKAMQPFFGPDQRGRVMGLWTTNYQAGGLLATVLATWLLAHYGWRAAFVVPALWVLVMSAIVFFALIEKPSDRGLPEIPQGPGSSSSAAPNTDSSTEQEAEPSMGTLLRNPVLLMIGSSYFGLKLIRYSLLFWLPYYLRRHFHYSEAQAGYLSLPFEVGGILGSIVIGWLSDRYFRKRRLAVAAPALVGLGAAVLAYQSLGHWGMEWNIALLSAVGFLLFGPDSLLSGTMSQEIGGARATARVAGIINGMGSVGATLSPLLVAWVSERFGWAHLFYGFVGVTLLAALLLWNAQQLLLKGAR